MKMINMDTSIETYLTTIAAVLDPDHSRVENANTTQKENSIFLKIDVSVSPLTTATYF